MVLVGKHELIYVDERAAGRRTTLTDDHLPELEGKSAPAAAHETQHLQAEQEDDEDLEATPPG